MEVMGKLKETERTTSFINLLIATVLLCLFLVSEGQTSNIAFWDAQQKGANYFNAVPTREWFESAAAANIKFVRLTYEKWKGAERDFLIGNVDEYKGIVEDDFQKLLSVLNIADSLDIKIVVTPISLPGARWVQNNNRVRDGRLWKEFKYHEQTCRFWRDLAQRLKDHPAVVGYNIQNEPHPEIFNGKNTFWKNDLPEWYETIKGTPADLNLFYRNVIAAIREVDQETPVVVSPGLYATPWNFSYLEKINDPHVVYSFHVYEPYQYTTQRLNDGKYKYPGKVPVDNDPMLEFDMNKATMADYLKPVSDWAIKNKIPANRIWAGEFGCSRKVEGVEKYLSDLIEIFNKNGWHWAFYSYREDVWENMDYELGTGNLPQKYWEYSSLKSLHLHYPEIYGQVKNNPIWPLFQKEFGKKE
jgi:endoglucanase